MRKMIEEEDLEAVILKGMVILLLIKNIVTGISHKIKKRIRKVEEKIEILLSFLAFPDSNHYSKC